MDRKGRLNDFCGQRVWPFLNTLLLVVIIILLIISQASQKNVGDSTIHVTLSENDLSCGIPGPCQYNTKTQNGKCGHPVNKPEGSVCSTPCVRSGVCTTDYSKTFEDGSTFMYCNATSNFECRGFCNSSTDCPVPRMVNDLQDTGVACIKSDDMSSIGTCFYAQRYAEFYHSWTTTVNWFIDVPQRTPTLNGVSLKSNVCKYIIKNQPTSEYDSSNPDPTYNKACLEYQSYFYGSSYTDLCIYQYECTRPDNLGSAISFVTGGDLIYMWGIYSYSSSNQTTISNGTRFSNFSLFMDAFISSLI